MSLESGSSTERGMFHKQSKGKKADASYSITVRQNIWRDYQYILTLCTFTVTPSSGNSSTS